MIECRRIERVSGAPAVAVRVQREHVSVRDACVNEPELGADGDVARPRADHDDPRKAELSFERRSRERWYPGDPVTSDEVLVKRDPVVEETVGDTAVRVRMEHVHVDVAQGLRGALSVMAADRERALEIDDRVLLVGSREIGEQTRQVAHGERAEGIGNDAQRDEAASELVEIGGEGAPIRADEERIGADRVLQIRAKNTSFQHPPTRTREATRHAELGEGRGVVGMRVAGRKHRRIDGSHPPVFVWAVLRGVKARR